MDKLQQVLKYQFWILLGVALILPFVGWYMATGGMVIETADRTKKLTALRDSLKFGSEDPNNEWQRQLAAINVDQQKQSLIAWWELFERQKPFMVWPSDMVDDPAKIEPFHQEIYREQYAGEFEKVRQIVKPADEEWRSGLVRLPEELLPPLQEEWKLQAPSIKQIEAAQEDLWLLAAILNCIASVNQDANTPFEAPIREIVELHLRGGSKTGAGGAPAGSSGAAQKGAGGAAMPNAAARGGAGAVGNRDSSAIGIADHKIKADEVLGPERPASDAKPADNKAAGAGAGAAAGAGAGAAAGTGAGAAAGAGAGAAAGGKMAMPPAAAGMGEGRPRSGGANMDRYRDDQKEFKTRGFSLEVVMDLQSVPDLLVALSNCEGWPINILRVHEADYKEEDLVIVDGGGNNVGAGGAGGGAGRGAEMAPRKGMPMGRGGMGARPAAAARPEKNPRPDDEGDSSPDNNRSPLNDPNLAKVAIVGLIYIFKPPTEALPAAPAEPPATPATPAAAASPAEPNGHPEADKVAEPENSADDMPEPASEDGDADKAEKKEPSE